MTNTNHKVIYHYHKLWTHRSWAQNACTV